MKQLILCLSVMLSSIVHSQWDVGYYLDDNGIETNDMFLYQYVVGKFNRGVKKNKKCIYFLEHNLADTSFIITIYPNPKKYKKEVWDYETFQWADIKSGSGVINSVESFCKDGIIFFDGIEYDEFMNAIKEEGVHTVTLKHTGSKTNYEFTFKK